MGGLLLWERRVERGDRIGRLLGEMFTYLREDRDKERAHQLAVMDRFNSRHFEEFTAGTMIGREVEIDQQQDGDEKAEEETVRQWLIDHGVSLPEAATEDTSQ